MELPSKKIDKIYHSNVRLPRVHFYQSACDMNLVLFDIYIDSDVKRSADFISEVMFLLLVRIEGDIINFICKIFAILVLDRCKP